MTKTDLGIYWARNIRLWHCAGIGYQPSAVYETMFSGSIRGKILDSDARRSLIESTLPLLSGAFSLISMVNCLLKTG